MIFKIKMHIFDLWPRRDLDPNFHSGAVCYNPKNISSMDAEH